MKNAANTKISGIVVVLKLATKVQLDWTTISVHMNKTFVGPIESLLCRMMGLNLNLEQFLISGTILSACMKSLGQT